MYSTGGGGGHTVNEVPRKHPCVLIGSAGHVRGDDHDFAERVEGTDVAGGVTQQIELWGVAINDGLVGHHHRLVASQQQCSCCTESTEPCTVHTPNNVAVLVQNIRAVGHNSWMLKVYLLGI